MHALEMEEIESLAGSRRKKLNQSRNNTKNKGGGCLSAIAQTRSFMGKLIIVAGLAFLLTTALSAYSGSEHKDSKVPKPSPPGPEPVGTPQAEPNNDSSPTQPPVPASTPSPTPKPVAQAATPDNGSGSTPSDETNTAMVYSNYATIPPLPGLELPDEAKKEKLGEKWGYWHFWDGDEDDRPQDDYTAEFTNRDMPSEKFDEVAWQSDAVFVNHFLNDAEQLTTRAMEAIFTEYGHGKPLPIEQLTERMKMFHWDKIDFKTQNGPPQKFAKGGNRGNGGWTTSRSFKGLVRRLLHAMITQDTFTVVLGGHSAAVGQGNHFRQSYMMQFHKIMQPIFGRLGVQLITRNMAQGGMGTAHSSMGSGSIYGNCDLLIWDSGMTENGNPELIDLFLRQALLSGDRVPVVWGGNFELLKMLHEEADVDVGELGTGIDGIFEVQSIEQAKEIPWAGRYMKCTEAAKEVCNAEPRFCTKCWIDRDDGIKPTMNQRPSPKGQVKWHPGWRPHQLQGRVLAFSVLEALSAAVNDWSEGTMGGPPLDDDEWHVTEYYDNIRNKLKNLDPLKGSCYKIRAVLPERLCTTPMMARTQYTPRANPEKTSLTSIIKATSDGYVPSNTKKALYEGPDARNTCLEVPEGEVDVYSIVASRRRLEPFQMELDESTSPRTDYSPPQRSAQLPSKATAQSQPKRSLEVNRSLQEVIEPGSGWEVFDEPQGYCDGTYEAVCALQGDVECALYGHHDARGAIVGNELSGWLVMTLADLKEGIIVLKLHTWHFATENTLTKDWTNVNNQQARHLRENGNSLVGDEANGAIEGRSLMRSYSTPKLPDDFIFEYAIDGKITSLSNSDFMNEKKQVQRVVETLTLLDDASFTSEPKTVEVGVRMRNCGRQCTFGVSHIYWA